MKISKLELMLIISILLIIVVVTLVLCDPGTKNDITMRNAMKVYRAGGDYVGDNQEEPSSIEDLIAGGYLKSIPINPWTKQPMRAIPLGQMPNYGDYTFISSYATIYSGKAFHRLERVCLLVVYGDPEEGFKNTEPDTFPFETFDVVLPEELEDTIIFAGGGIATISTRMKPPYSIVYPELQDALRENGYTLPIEIKRIEDSPTHKDKGN